MLSRFTPSYPIRRSATTCNAFVATDARVLDFVEKTDAWVLAQINATRSGSHADMYALCYGCAGTGRIGPGAKVHSCMSRRTQLGTVVHLCNTGAHCITWARRPPM
jgi:hypothetical protein